MEPITHLMTGACLARAGFNRKAAYATVAMTLAAELPDLDSLWSIRGPIAAFQHHRGWTHTFLGLPFEAAALVGILYLFHRRKTKQAAVKPASPTKPPAAPIRWPLLFVFTLIALLSHLALDWTNNYGLRPFFPFNPRWYAGSFVFIFEPVIFAMLLVALLAPSLFSLINTEVGVRRDKFRGRGWAIAALLGVAALWTWRFVEKNKALQLLSQEDFNGAQIIRVNVSPHPITPFRWHAVIETPTYYQLATVDTLAGTITTDQANLFYKPLTTIATLIAKRSWLGEAYLDWSQFPIVQEAAKSPEPNADPDNQGLTTVTFRDLRFLYDVPFLAGRDHPPLSGSVTIDDDRKIVRMEMTGTVQR